MAEQRAFLWAAMDQMGSAVLITDGELDDPGPRIVYANEAFRDLSGYAAEELLGRSPRMLRGDDADEAALKQLRRALRAGREFDGELLNHRKDGTPYWTHVRISPIRDDAGGISHWISINRDVSEERRWAEEMRRINAVLSAQMELSPDGILVVDVDDNVIAFNGRFRDMWDIPLESFATGRQQDLLPHILEKVDDPEACRAGMEAFYRSREKRLEDEVILSDGRIFERYCVTTHSPQGQFYGWLWFFSDVTQRREFEHRLGVARREAEAANLAKTQFLANMSHEIRTPLNGIIGMTEILLQTEVTNEQRDFLSTIQASGDNLLILINDLLDLSRIESGRLELEETAFDLFSLVEDSLAVVGARVGTKDLDLGYLIAPELPERFCGDENRVRQILINLLGNAVKFTEWGEVVLEVKAVDSDTPAGDSGFPERMTLHFSVRDTGIGISAEDQAKLFKPFSQVDPSTTRRYGGSGLGLSICRRLVDLMGGEIWLESTPDQGSVFYFTIPMKVDADAVRRLPTYMDLSGRTLLVVDDNEVNRSMVRHQASRQEIRVDEAHDGPSALEKWRSGRSYDLLVVDMQMPGMDGLTLARQIRDLPGGESQPMLLATSLGRYGRVKQEAAELELFFLAKPFRQFQFIALLCEIFGMEDRQSDGTTDEPERERDGVDPNLRVLLAEDNQVNRKVALGLLNRLGLEVDSVPDGREAVERCRQGSYDVIFMDVHMPEMDGLEATRRIRRLSTREDRPWIVAMTADALVEDRARCMAAGMNDYLSKPVKSIDLAGVLRRMPSGGDVPAEVDTASKVEPAGGAPEETEPDISEKALEDLAALGEAGDEDFLRELVEVFLADAPEQIGVMRESRARSELAELKRAAHSVKGASVNFGATRLRDECQKLENRAKAGELDGVERLIDNIEALFSRVDRRLRERFPGLG